MTIDKHGPSVIAMMSQHREMATPTAQPRPKRNNDRVSNAVNVAMKNVHPWYRKAIKYIADGRYEEGRALLVKFHELPQTRKDIAKRCAARDQAAAATE